MSWAVAGTYLESCNCDSICPCRRIGGVPGGRSQHGICLGVLSWQIKEGRVDGTDLAGLAVALVYRYDDDEQGSPWSMTLHVDERAGTVASAALADIFLGRAGGARVQALPWVRKPVAAIEVRSSRIDIDHASERRFLRVADRVTLTISRPYKTDQTVTCIITSHDRPGTELVAERLSVRGDVIEAEFSGKTGFTAGFAYSSDD